MPNANVTPVEGAFHKKKKKKAPVIKPFPCIPTSKCKSRSAHMHDAKEIAAVHVTGSSFIGNHLETHLAHRWGGQQASLDATGGGYAGGALTRKARSNGG